MLNNVMTIKEASERWGLNRTTLLRACTGQKGYKPRFNEDDCQKSGDTWLITEDAMMREYGMEIEKVNKGKDAIKNYFKEWYNYDDDQIKHLIEEYCTHNANFKFNGKTVEVLWYLDTDTELVYLIEEGRFLDDEELEEFSKQFEG